MARSREEMVQQQLVRRGITDDLVLEAFSRVERHEFVAKRLQSAAYGDHPLAIGAGQTISQPYMVAIMTQLLEVRPGDRVLEIGTGSGYQAAILAEIVGTENVYTIEIVSSLAKQAMATLKELGYGEIHGKTGDGYQGWPEHAPFKGIVVTAAPERIPQPLLDQLADGGRLVIPVDNDYGYQTLKVITRHGDRFVEKDSIDCRFVPFLGEHGKAAPPQ